MKNLASVRCLLAALFLTTLGGCASSVVPTMARSAEGPVVLQQTVFFQQAEVDDAANAYAQAYVRAITESLAAGKYIESLAYQQANAESCLSSRAQRLLGRELTTEEKRMVRSGSVTEAQVQAYQKLSHGYFVRANGLEMFSCDHAGLKVASSARH